MKWISVKDRMPEIGINILVYCYKGNLGNPFIFTCYWDGEYLVDQDDKCSTLETSDYWMPFPEPPL